MYAYIMRILIAGDWHSDLHEEAMANALVRLGQEVTRFPWHQYFRWENALTRLFSPALRFQNKYLLGPVIRRLNVDLLDCVAKERPDVCFIYRGSHIYQETLRQLRRASPGSLLVGYNNDDPFSKSHAKYQWRHFLRGLPEYDLVLAYRHHNLTDFVTAGARRVNLLRSWYVPDRNHPVVLTRDERARFQCDVVFVGHYEQDGRLQCLEEIVRRGWKLKLYGHDYGWHPALRCSPILRELMPVHTVWGTDYNKALCGARVALCFLSKLNRDTYTRRSFEIPASGTFMLSEYTEDLANLYEEGVEADFFRSPAQLAEKLSIYLNNENLRRHVADAGRRRVANSGHDIVSRMRQLLLWIHALLEEKCHPHLTKNLG
jgi:spore maturation protein CgeB